MYHKNFVKKYSPLDATFSNLPAEVREVLVHKFSDLDNLHFEKLRQLGPLDHPTGLVLDYEVLAESPDEHIDKEDLRAAKEYLEKHTPLETLEKYMKPSPALLEVSNEVHNPSLKKYLNEQEPNDRNSFSAESNPKVTVQYSDETNLISDLPVSHRTAVQTKRRKRKQGTVNQDRAVTRSARLKDQDKQSDPEEDSREAPEVQDIQSDPEEDSKEKPEVVLDSESDSDSDTRKKVQFENAYLFRLYLRSKCSG